MTNNPLISIVIVTHQRSQELKRCLESLEQSTYRNTEVIIVNNGGSVDDESFKNEIKQKDWIKIIHTGKNLGAAEGRNVGYRAAQGDYILFGDDDAYFDNQMVNEIYQVFQEKKHAGIVQPIIYDIDQKETIVAVGHGINLLTGRLFANSVGQKDTGEYTNIQEIHMAGCIWMVKREVFDKIGEYDAEYFIPYEDSDFSIRAKKAGYQVFLAPKAKAYHPLKKKTTIPDAILYIGITSPERAFRVMRNKIIFMKKHAPILNLILFSILFLPTYFILHSFLIIKEKRFDILKMYYLGYLSGLKYLISKKGSI